MAFVKFDGPFMNQSMIISHLPHHSGKLQEDIFIYFILSDPILTQSYKVVPPKRYLSWLNVTFHPMNHFNNHKPQRNWTYLHQLSNLPTATRALESQGKARHMATNLGSAL